MRNFWKILALFAYYRIHSNIVFSIDMPITSVLGKRLRYATVVTLPALILTGISQLTLITLRSTALYRFWNS